MTSKPHLCFGVLNGMVVTSFYQMSDATFVDNPLLVGVAIATTVVGSVAPDIDAPGSMASKVCPFIARPIQVRWAHRTLIHSLLGTVIFGVGLYLILSLCLSWSSWGKQVTSVGTLFFCSAFIGHLLIDTFTISGVKWFYPFSRSFVYPTERRYRMRSGDKKKEMVLSVLFLLGACGYLPVVQAGGVTRGLHRAFENYAMAKEDFLHSENIETYLQFSGTYRHNRKTVSGRGLILDVKDGFVVYMNGHITTIGKEALIYGTSYVCEYTGHAPQTSDIAVQHESMSSLLSRMPDNVLISGELVSDKSFQATTPVYTDIDFSTIKVSSKGLAITFAREEEIEGLQVRIPEDIRLLMRKKDALQDSVGRVSMKIEEKTQQRSQTKDLVIRHDLLEDIDELQRVEENLIKEHHRLEERLYEWREADVYFSGKLNLRHLPLKGGPIMPK